MKFFETAKEVGYRIPLVGQMAREASRGGEGALGLFALNYAGLALIATIIWGLPALVVAAKIAAAVMMIVLIVIMNGRIDGLGASADGDQSPK